MSATSFQRARRLAAQRLGLKEETAPVGYSEAIDILNQPEPEEFTTVADLEEIESDSESETVLTREQREAQLKAMNWEALKELLGSYELPTSKPKGISWDEFAIPQILEHESF